MTEKQHIQKFLRRLAQFLVLLVIFDLGLGYGFKLLFENQKAGRYYKTTYALEKSEDEVVIFGNSRAERQYIPEIIEEKTGLSCYNTGQGGQDIMYSKAVQNAMFARHVPKVVVLEMHGHELLTPIKYDRLSFLHPYYKDHKEIRPLLEKRGSLEGLKFVSRMYAYNSVVWGMLRAYTAPEESYDGYRPLKGKLKTKTLTAEEQKVDEAKRKQGEKEIDTEKVEMIEQFLADAKSAGSKVVVVSSPIFVPAGEEAGMALEKTALESMVKNHGVELWDYSDDPDLAGRPEMYKDVRHLNHAGATIFTQKVAERLKAYPEHDPVLRAEVSPQRMR